MSLSPGQRIGPYEVVAPLGAGGMGEVFVARDTRLGREVALKVLPRDLATDSGRRARFEREARAISALSHPNVCALFDVGCVGGPGGEIEYLVMEKLEGETLATRLARGPLPPGEVLALGSQLAGGLAAAHRRGIVHRDVKPANVMLTRSGAKLLDFGLARQDDDDPARASREEPTATLATAAQPLSRAGAVMGTWPYLSPEQVRGGPADARSDVFALGAVLHEALTGRRAFPGTTAAEIAAAILGADPPDLREVAPVAPPGLGSLVRQCLAKDPDARWQCADDVAHGLRLVEEALARPAAEPRRAPSSRRALALGGAGLALAVAAGLLVALRPRPAEPLRFAVAPPAGALLPRPTLGTPIAVSPDGRRIAFTATTGGVPGLWLWSAEDGRSRPLEGTAGATAPFFSPDGREIAFFAQDELRRVPAEGGPARAIAPAPLGSTGTWGPDGTVLFARAYGPEAGLWSVPARGGEARHRVPAASLGDVRFFPRFLPDGRHYLYLRGVGEPAAERRLCVAALDGGEPDCFAACHSQGEYSASGHVLCVRSGTLLAQPFDARRRKTTGEAVPLEKDVRWFGPSGAGSFAVSGDGRTLVHEPRPAPSRLAWLDGNGREIAPVGEPRAYGLVRLASDGRRAAVDVWDAEGRGRDVWSLDATSGVLDRLTFDPVDAWAPAWSPRGDRIAYAKAAGGPPDVTVLHLDGSRREETILRAAGVQSPRDWSPDGELIAYEDYSPSRRDQRQVWLVTLDGRARQVAFSPVGTYHPRFSPDGRRIAYVSEESGRPEVYILDLAGGRPARRVSRAGGLLPRWRGDGGELFFFQPDGMMMAVLTADGAAAPRSLFHLEGVTAVDFDYDVARDGRRFLARLAAEAEGAAGLRVSLEWSMRLGVPAAEAR